MGDDQGRSVELAPLASPRSRFALVSPAVDHERAPENVEQAGSDGLSSSPRLRHSASARASRKLLAAPSSWKDGLVSLGREAGRQAARNKCSFCLGLGTCLLTVITAATMQSLLAASKQ